MTEKMIVMNRTAYPVACTAEGHMLRPGQTREVDKGDEVAERGLAAGLLGIPEAPKPARRTKTKNQEQN